MLIGLGGPSANQALATGQQQPTGVVASRGASVMPPLPARVEPTSAASSSVATRAVASAPRTIGVVNPLTKALTAHTVASVSTPQGVSIVDRDQATGEEITYTLRKPPLGGSTVVEGSSSWRGKLPAGTPIPPAVSAAVPPAAAGVLPAGVAGTLADAAAASVGAPVVTTSTFPAWAKWGLVGVGLVGAVVLLRRSGAQQAG